MQHLFIVLGRGGISSAEISFVSSPESFLTEPPTFTLRCVTFGGPPEVRDNLWALAGAGMNLVNSSIYTISRIIVNGTSPDVHRNPRYSSTLTVTGNYPADYVCRAHNRVVRNQVIQAMDSITIEGIKCMLTQSLLLGAMISFDLWAFMLV